MSKTYFFRGGPLVDGAPSRQEYKIAEACESITRSGLHGEGRQTFNGMPASNGVGVRNW